MSKSTGKITIISILAAIILWSGLIYYIGPNKIVGFLGFHNGYLVVFLISALGGVSTFTSSSTYATVATLAIGGLNFILLGILAGIGATIGDGAFYFIGFKSRRHLKGKLKRVLQKIAKWLDKRPGWFLPVAVYFYSGFAPIPNDLMMLTVSLSGSGYRQIALANFLGNTTFMLLLAYLAQSGVRLLGIY